MKFATPEIACVDQGDQVVLEQDTIPNQKILDPDFQHINLRLCFSGCIDFWKCSGYSKYSLLQLVHSPHKVKFLSCDLLSL